MQSRWGNKNMSRKTVILKLYLYGILGKNHDKVKLIRKSGLFNSFGNGGYWHPNWLPSYPELISIGNNVTVSADVRFYEHDEVFRLYNGNPSYKGPKVGYYKGKINISDNVVIGARSIILYNVDIGHDCVVAAGSVVTKDVEPYSIVAGNPAKKIGDTRELLNKRLMNQKEESNV